MDTLSAVLLALLLVIGGGSAWLNYRFLTALKARHPKLWVEMGSPTMNHESFVSLYSKVLGGLWRTHSQPATLTPETHEFYLRYRRPIIISFVLQVVVLLLIFGRTAARWHLH